MTVSVTPWCFHFIFHLSSLSSLFMEIMFYIKSYVGFFLHEEEQVNISISELRNTSRG